MSFTIGVVLFALALAISIALHEFGHLVTAKAFGMKARRYFIGFGPKVWSFRRGETEYGLKAIPAGGFVDIAGMSHVEDLPHDDEPRAFWRFAAWKRVVVMAAGSVTHFAVALVVLYGLSFTSGLPTGKMIVGDVPSCVVLDATPKTGEVRDCQPGDPPGPAAQAGLRKGDEIVAIDDSPIRSFDDLVAQVRTHPNQDLTFRYLRDGTEHTTVVHTVEGTRLAIEGDPKRDDNLSTVGLISILPSTTERFGPLTGVGGTLSYTGSLIGATFSSLKEFPAKIPKLIDALAGQQRDPGTPVSVVGASRIGGQAIQAGSWPSFFMMLAIFNMFIGIFNLLPLLPLDGGHIAILLYERARSAIAKARGRRDPGHVDPTKLVPLTLVVILVFGGISLLTILTDIVNPIANPFD